MSSNYTVGSIVSLCRKKSLDEDDTDNTDTELINLYNLTTRQIVKLVPRAYTRLDSMQLLAGNKQTIPAAGSILIDVLRNMGLDGVTAGRSIRPTSVEIMTKYVPSYSTDDANADSSVWDWWPIPTYPEQFFVYPKSDGLGYVEVEITKTPEDVIYDANGAWAAAAILLSDLYVDAIINGILYMMYDDDTDIPGNTPRSGLYYSRFLQSLGLQTGGE